MTDKAVIFDLDDTLVRTTQYKWAQHQEVARRFYGVDLDESTLRSHWGKPSRELVEAYYQSSEPVEVKLQKFHSLDDEFPKTLIEDVPYVLGQLVARNLIIGIVTNGRKESVQKDVVRLGLPIQDIHFIHAYEDTKAYKPDPSAFRLANSILQSMAITDITYVGDSLTDFYASRDAGMDFVGVTSGLATQKDFLAAGAANVVSDIKQILRIV